MKINDIEADVRGWVNDQLGKSATEEMWFAITPTITPINGQPVAGIMILYWCRNPILGDPHISTGSLITGIASEADVRKLTREAITKLKDQKAEILRAPVELPVPGSGRFNSNLRGFRP